MVDKALARKAERTERQERLERRLGRFLTWAVLGGAVCWGLLATVIGVVTLVGQLLQDRFSVTLMNDASLPASPSAGTAQITDTGIALTQVTVTGLSALPRFLLTLESSTAVATTLLVSATVAYFCWGVLRSRPFSRPVLWLVGLVGYALLLGTVLGQGFGGLGRVIAGDELNGSPGASADGFWLPATLVDLAPAGMGLVLLVAAGAISLGQRLQHDADGLV